MPTTNEILRKLILNTAEQLKLDYSKEYLDCEEYDVGKPLRSAKEIKQLQKRRGYFPYEE